MLQKYKVFIGDNPLLIIAPEALSDPHSCDYELKADCPDYELDSLYIQMMRHQNVKAIWQHSDPLKAFTRFCKLYKIVEAAGGLVQFEDKYLFILRHGKWDLPKGKAEKGEMHHQTAKREVEEECGIKVDFVGVEAGITYHTYERDGFRVLKPSYWFWMEIFENQELIAQEEEGITQVAFLDASEIEAILDDMYVSIRELVISLKLNHPKP